ncbi:MAG: LLM class F420-dependent oxidoreductase [Acidimicrobiales bacterium]
MHVGVVFPQIEIGSDRGAVRAYGEAVDGLGYHHLLAYDHVVGADPEVHQGWNGPYSITDPFHEPMVLFGYLAGFTGLELVSGIVIAPQRQSVLLAKQAAEVDVLCDGRLRLGVGIGWNALEYEALGKDFSDRSKRIEEQVVLMRELWTSESVTFEGTYERCNGVGLLPMPVQRPIPIWFGGIAPAALRRIGRIADGWFPLVRFGDDLKRALALVQDSAEEAGRAPIPFEGRVSVDARAEKVDKHLEGWRDVGAAYVSLDTMRQGFTSVDDHIAALTIAAQATLAR